jgi:hypothetical protein
VGRPGRDARSSGVQIERDRLPIEQRLHARKQLVKRPIQLADVAETEAAQKAAERCRLRKPVPAQKLLRRVPTQQRDIVETHSPPASSISHRPRIASAGK